MRHPLAIHYFGEIISIHAPHARCDYREFYFKPRVDISIHAPHARCDSAVVLSNDDVKISIHAPHARCDGNYETKDNYLADFNPRTSCEVRLYYHHHHLNRGLFQSTHLMRGATNISTNNLFTTTFQSTHLMRGATDAGKALARQIDISIHAPHARCDWVWRRQWNLRYDFNPRTSCEVRLRSFVCSLHLDDFNPRTSCEVRHAISHAFSKRLDFNPRTSCEVRPSGIADLITNGDFNPRTSCEVRLFNATDCSIFARFQSTHLMRGATSFANMFYLVIQISIHAPHARCDSADITKDASYTNTRKSARFLFYLRH